MVLHRGAEKAGGLAGQRQALLLDGGNAVLPPPAPVDQGIFHLVFLILYIIDIGVGPALLLVGVIANELDYLLASGPHLPAGRIVVAEFFLRTGLVLQGTPLVAIGQSGEGAGTEALLLQCQAVPIHVHVFYHCDLRHPVIYQPLVHDGQVLIGVGLLAACIRKENEVGGDIFVVHSNQHSGTVCAAAIRDDIHSWLPIAHLRSQASRVLRASESMQRFPARHLPEGASYPRFHSNRSNTQKTPQNTPAN